MSDERINSPATSNNSVATSLYYFGRKWRVKFDESCLKEAKITFTHKKTVNNYIIYIILIILFIIILFSHEYDDYPSSRKLFFYVVKLVKKNADIYKYKYFG